MLRLRWGVTLLIFVLAIAFMATTGFMHLLNKKSDMAVTIGFVGLVIELLILLPSFVIWWVRKFILKK